MNQQQGQNEIIKCVLVGDSGVGKTCLVCAWACNAKYDLKSLVKSHAATVWATDHYRYDKEVCYFMGHDQTTTDMIKRYAIFYGPL